jgi:hypothetical protein
MPSDNVEKRIRLDERLPVLLNASVNNTDCLTRDISASGVYLESSDTFDLGNRIDFSIELKSPGGALVLNCKGEVVRIEKLNGKIGVAIKIVESVMKPG